MADPRSKPKIPKNKTSRAPHANQQTKLTAQVTAKPQMKKSQGRGK